jgi:hypothetical protein
VNGGEVTTIEICQKIEVFMDAIEVGAVHPLFGPAGLKK